MMLNKSVKYEKSKPENNLKTPNYVHCPKSTCLNAADIAKKVLLFKGRYHGRKICQKGPKGLYRS